MGLIYGTWWIIKINGKQYAHSGSYDGVVLGALRRHPTMSDKFDIFARLISKEEKEKYKSFAAFRRAIEEKN